MLRGLFAIAVLLVTRVSLHSDEAMRSAADAFLATLTPSLKAEVLKPFDEARRTWTYLPGEREGVCWQDMSEPQCVAARKLLQAALSEAGYTKVEAIRKLETHLRQVESNPGRDPDKYWFAFFGTPSKDRPWSWRYEGHHLSLTFTLANGEVVATTPQFLGSNPAEVRSGPQKGTRPLAKEQDLAFQLMESFTSEQRVKAIIASDAPADIVTGSSRKVAIAESKGLDYSSMSAPQRKLLADLVRVHAEIQKKPEVERRVKALGEGLVFAWMGAVERGGRHYYRIQSKSVIIEYDNTQADGNHIHTAWRDVDHDFGGDALIEHYHLSHR